MTVSKHLAEQYRRYSGIGLGLYMAPGEFREQLLALILDGTKRATCSLLDEYDRAGEVLPKPGYREIAVDSFGRPVCVLEFTDVEVIPWCDITDVHVAAEGEGHSDVEQYKREHEAFWSDVCGKRIDDYTQVVFCHLKVVEDLRGKMPLGSRLPLVQAPMAGGPSCAALAHAVCSAGGLGYLAGGYKTVEALAEEIEEVEQTTGWAYGVNLFVPAELAQGRGNNSAALGSRHQCTGDWIRQEAFNYYREVIAGEYDGELPDELHAADDAYPLKLDLVANSNAAVVSFTFGIPPQHNIERLQKLGKLVALNAISFEGIDAAIAAGADVLTLQGIEAGGHRAANAHIEDDITQVELDALFDYARAHSNIPIVVAGGIATPDQVSQWLERGAAGVQLGTAFLSADEAGTKPLHREALVQLRDRETVQTRAFSGRLARGIRNDFADRYSESAPALYPELHYLTAPIKAGGDVEKMSLWAGTGFAKSRAASAASIIEYLCGV